MNCGGSLPTPMIRPVGFAHTGANRASAMRRKPASAQPAAGGRHPLTPGRGARTIKRILSDRLPESGVSRIEPQMDLDLVVVGGCGHVGLPLAMSFADVGCHVGIYDTDLAKVEQVRRGEMPFRERGADEMLKRTLEGGRLELSNEAAILQRTDAVIMVIGTPIDEFMNPSTRLFERVVNDLAPWLRKNALVILRSTVFPGTTAYVKARLHERGVEVEVAFCPERIAEGYALQEIRP